MRGGFWFILFSGLTASTALSQTSWEITFFYGRQPLQVDSVFSGDLVIANAQMIRLSGYVGGDAVLAAPKIHLSALTVQGRLFLLCQQCILEDVLVDEKAILSVLKSAQIRHFRVRKGVRLRARTLQMEGDTIQGTFLVTAQDSIVIHRTVLDRAILGADQYTEIKQGTIRQHAMVISPALYLEEVVLYDTLMHNAERLVPYHVQGTLLYRADLDEQARALIKRMAIPYERIGRTIRLTLWILWIAFSGVLILLLSRFSFLDLEEATSRVMRMPLRVLLWGLGLWLALLLGSILALITLIGLPFALLGFLLIILLLWSILGVVSVGLIRFVEQRFSLRFVWGVRMALAMLTSAVWLLLLEWTIWTAVLLFLIGTLWYGALLYGWRSSRQGQSRNHGIAS